MSLTTSKIRVKEKIRYDISVHREQNKQILLNLRRGVVVEEHDKNDAFSIEDMQSLALEIKRRKKITTKHLKVLKHALLNGQEFISTFYRVQGAVDSLLHYVTDRNEGLQLRAIECFCNMALGDKKTCNKLTKSITPYLTIYINHLNVNISSMSIWTLGNLSDSDEDSCKILQDQNFFGRLINCLKNSTCDEVISNIFYALKLFLKTYINYLQVEELNNLFQVCFKRMDSWKESFWIVYQISCRQDCAFLDERLIKHLFYCIHTDENSIGIKYLVPILRTLGNTIAMDSSGCLANEFIVGLRNEGTVIRNILLQNRQINLNYECAWLLGNVLNVLKINDLNKNNCLTVQNFNEICDCLFV